MFRAKEMLCLAMVIASLILAGCGGDSGGGDSGSTALTVDVPVDGSVGGNTYNEYHIVVGATDSTYAISLTNQSIDLSWELGYWSPDGWFVTEQNCDNNFDTTDELCTTALLTANSTNLLIVPNYSSTPGTYTITSTIPLGLIFQK